MDFKHVSSSKYFKLADSKKKERYNMSFMFLKIIRNNFDLQALILGQE